MSAAIAPQSRTGWGLVVPLVILMALGVNLPLIFMLGSSFFEDGSFTLANYSAALIDTHVYLKVLTKTFKIAVITTIVCILLGYPLAYWLRGLSPRWQAVGLGLVVIPFWISILVRTYAWIVLMGNTGIVNSLLSDIGLISEPIQFLYNDTGVLIGTINILLPFLVLPLFAAMRKIDDRLLQAAQTLGAGRLTIFWRIFFPLSVPALAAGSVLVFILTLGFYITPAILGGGRVPMIANMLDLLINQIPQWELASSISVVLLGATLILFAIYLKVNTEERAV